MEPDRNFMINGNANEKHFHDRVENLCKYLNNNNAFLLGGDGSNEKGSSQRNSNKECVRQPNQIEDNRKILKEAEIMEAKELEDILDEIEHLNKELEEEELLNQYNKNKNNKLTKHVSALNMRAYNRHPVQSSNKELEYVQKMIQLNKEGINYLNEIKSPNFHSKTPFQTCLNVSKFLPNELTAQIIGNKFIITGKHEDRFENKGFITRKFARKFILNKYYDVAKADVCLYTNGILEIKIPLKEENLRKRN